jgi:hypothetical protein
MTGYPSTIPVTELLTRVSKSCFRNPRTTRLPSLIPLQLRTTQPQGFWIPLNGHLVSPFSQALGWYIPHIINWLQGPIRVLPIRLTPAYTPYRELLPANRRQTQDFIT